MLGTYAFRPPAKRLMLGLAALVAALSLSAAWGVSDAFASHERGLNLSWVQVANHKVDFTLTGAFRRDGYSGTAGDGLPQPGDIITESIGGTNLGFGDGGSTGTLRFLVTSINIPDNYLQGIALEPGSNTDTAITHDYSGFSGTDKDNFTAQVTGCCTIGELHNNAGANYGVQSQVHFGLDDASPVSSLPVIIGVGNSGVQHYTVPATDDDVPGPNHFRFRRPGSLECGGCSTDNPAGWTIDPNTGQVSWDTTGLPQGLWYSSVVIEEVSPSNVVVSTTMVQNLLNISNATTNNEPAFTAPTPPDGKEFTVAPGSPLSFSLAATDPDGGDTVAISASGIPQGASFTHTDGNPASATFSWTPTVGQEGDYVVNFTPTDNHGLAGPFRSFTIHVQSTPIEDCDNGVDDDGDGLADANDPDCSGTPSENCANGIDDDGDGKIDGADPDCRVPTGLTCNGLTPTVIGTNGDDNIIGTSGVDVIASRSGNDKVQGRGGDDIICLGDGADVAFGGDGNDEVYGQNGDDRIVGGVGDDLLRGNAGNDQASGNAGDDRLFGDAGTDTLSGNDGDDRVQGDAGDDHLSGGIGGDSLYGGADNDTLFGNEGADYVDGGAGDDRVDGGKDGDRVLGQGGDDYVLGQDGVDRVDGGPGADHLNGGAGDDRESGGPGNDQVQGGTGADLLFGDADDDDLFGEAGNDRLFGGTEVDFCSGDGDTDTASECETTTGVP
jgi:Ca2+-binding RTX toxin-like protein